RSDLARVCPRLLAASGSGGRNGVQPAADLEGFARDPRRLGATKEYDGSGDVFRLSPAAEWNGLTYPINHLVLADVQRLGARDHDRAVQVRVDRARTDSVDTDVLGGKFDRERLRQAEHAGLAHVVRRDKWGSG